MTVTHHAGRTFDYRPRHDPRSLNYRVAAADPGLLARSRFWVPSRFVLDQGREGACVGHGVAHEAAASPVRVRGIDETVAHAVYKRAQQLDPWPGEAYEGTSVLAGMKAGQERSWWSGYRWALSMAELRAALEEGPVVVGVEWRDGMYRASDGVVTATGRVVGGHALLVTGYTPRHRVLKAPAYRWRNSWGPGYGINGSAYISADDLYEILYAAGGEAAVPVGRAA
jgi:hypothetical protein